MSDPVQPSFLARFAALRDPRQVSKVPCHANRPLLWPFLGSRRILAALVEAVRAKGRWCHSPKVLLLPLRGTIAEADDFVELALWG